MNFFYVMQEKFNFIYDAEHHPSDLDLIIRGIDREATDIYRNWKYNLHRAYRNNVQIDSITRARQQKPRAVRTMDQWQLTCDLFKSEAYKVSEILIHILFFSFYIFYSKIVFVDILFVYYLSKATFRG